MLTARFAAAIPDVFTASLRSNLTIVRFESFVALVMAASRYTSVESWKLLAKLTYIAHTSWTVEMGSHASTLEAVHPSTLVVRVLLSSLGLSGPRSDTLNRPTVGSLVASKVIASSHRALSSL